VWRERAALEALTGELLRDEARLAQPQPQPLAALGKALIRSEGNAAPSLAAAQARHPNDFWLSIRMGNVLESGKKWDEAVGYFRLALALRLDSATAHDNLGWALSQKEQWDEAIREYRVHCTADRRSEGCIEQEPIGMSRHLGIVEVTTASQISPF
jgi:tetratricopeptide (TPR) repeat protein